METHNEIAELIASKGHKVYDIGNCSVIVKNVKAKRIEGTYSYESDSEMDYYGYNDVGYELVSLVYEVDGDITITSNVELSNIDESELESKILEEIMNNEC